MEKLVIAFIQDRVTKNTVRYEEQPPEGKPPTVGTIYIQKWTLGAEPPKAVTITIEGE